MSQEEVISIKTKTKLVYFGKYKKKALFRKISKEISKF
jgi:hypothetical protein